MNSQRPSEDEIFRTLDLLVQDIKSKSDSNRNASDCTVGNLRDIDKKIETIKSVELAFQKAVEVQLAHYRRRRNTVTSTLLQCPNEIISEIFLHLVENTSIEHRYQYLYNLQLVCSPFYHISEMTGRLWACIDTDLLERKSITEPSYLIDKLLKKSKNALLDIKLRFREENLWGALGLLDRVGPHSHRWRSFLSSCVVQLPTSPPWLEAVEESMRRLCGMKAPQLREFDVSFMDERSLPKLSKLFDDFAPRLQWLNIIGIPISWDSPILSGLTRLGLSAWNSTSTPTVDQYLRVLLSCPMLESLEIKGRRIDCTRDNLDAVFYHSIPLPNLNRLILDHLHPSTVRSLLSSIKADFKVLETTFGGIPTEKCQDVISSVFLNRHARHFLHSFAISESQVCIESLNSGSCVVFEVSIGSERHEMFNCTFTNVMTPMPLYRTLLPPSTRATICDLFLHATVGNSLFTEDFGPRELFTELKELRVLTLLDQNSDPWVILESLSKPVSETNSGRRWLCPHLHDLSIEFATFGIDHLWEFLESRYIGDDPPTSLSRLGVLWNDYYDEITDIPIDVASKVVQLVGMDVFSWNSHRFYAGKGAWIRMY